MPVMQFKEREGIARNKALRPMSCRRFLLVGPWRSLFVNSTWEKEMPFTSFNTADFSQTGALRPGEPIPDPLASKIEDLRQGLGAFPEFQLDFFRKRIVRRPGMRGQGGLVFGSPRVYEGHWFFFIVGGDQDQVQLNIGMFENYIRVGMGFMIGRQVAPKIPAFYVLQSFLGMRPPLPFRDAFYSCVQRNSFQIEDLPTRHADELLHRLETYVIPSDNTTIFVFIGAIWDIATAGGKGLDDYRSVFLELMPFYEEILLAGGRYIFYI